MPYQPRDPEIALKDGAGIIDKLIRAEEGTIGTQGHLVTIMMFLTRDKMTELRSDNHPIYHLERINSFQDRTIRVCSAYIGDTGAAYEATPSTA
jgi:hypothetical protein